MPPDLGLGARATGHRQIYDRVRESILAGRLKPGDRLPSARSLASQLGVARGTVDAAYQRLAGEGFIVGRGAAGTIVDPSLRLPTPDARGARRASSEAAHPPHGAKTVPHFDVPALFQLGLPALDLFPRKTWSRLAARSARDVGVSAMVAGDSRGSAALRAEIAAYLGVARGIACDASQVIVTGGFLGALGLVARVLGRSGDAAWIENPGYPFARRALSLAGMNLAPVPVDANGLDVEAGRRLAPRARFAVVTPTHQFPLGAMLPLARRLALLEWARAADAWIVEDDYDAEFRFTGPPPPALKSLDADGRVLYVGTFSKVLFPGLRLAYLVVPPALVDRFAEAAALLQPLRNAVGEATVAAFMREGYFARHIRRMRGAYAERRQALADALTDALGARLAVIDQGGGMHLVARLRGRESDVAWVRHAVAAGMAPIALSGCTLPPAKARGLLFGFTNVPPREAPAAARRLRAAIDG